MRSLTRQTALALHEATKSRLNLINFRRCGMSGVRRDREHLILFQG